MPKADFPICPGVAEITKHHKRRFLKWQRESVGAEVKSAILPQASAELSQLKVVRKCAFAIGEARSGSQN
jgi:hypothetical protein